MYVHHFRNSQYGKHIFACLYQFLNLANFEYGYNYTIEQRHFYLFLWFLFFLYIQMMLTVLNLLDEFHEHENIFCYYNHHLLLIFDIFFFRCLYFIICFRWFFFDILYICIHIISNTS